VINGVCHTANSIFKRYRNQFSSDKLVAELAASQVGAASSCWGWRTGCMCAAGGGGGVDSCLQPGWAL
jgi:hypothetical protein